MTKIVEIMKLEVEGGTEVILAYGDDRQLYINGEPVHSESRLTLTFWQKVLGVGAALGAIGSGLSDLVGMIRSFF